MGSAAERRDSVLGPFIDPLEDINPGRSSIKRQAENLLFKLNEANGTGIVSCKCIDVRVWGQPIGN